MSLFDRHKQTADKTINKVFGGVESDQYKSLLQKYIQHVRSCEGVDFINDGAHHSDIIFTPEEWNVLEDLANSPDSN